MQGREEDDVLWELVRREKEEEEEDYLRGSSPAHMLLHGFPVIYRTCYTCTKLALDSLLFGIHLPGRACTCRQLLWIYVEYQERGL